MALLDFLDKRNKDKSAEMSFVDHLEELRWHIIRSLIAVIIGAVAVFVFIYQVVDDILFAPAKPDFITAQWFCEIGRKIGLGEGLCFGNVQVQFIETTMTGQFISSFTLAFVGGFIVAFPYVFWEFWKFVRPALSTTEVKKTRGIIFWVSLLFFAGVAFGYFILTPFMVNFYFTYKLSPLIEIKPTFSDYLENFTYTTVGVGILFQLPLLILLLAKVGFLTASFLRKYRRHALVVILIVAAIITPTTDPFSLTIVTLPLYLLYEAGIRVAARVEKKRAKNTDEWS
ncbi:MAG TPA: twin-arginine translocase subunit TatC [Chitinophagaceae bacterium]|nr:twin-arginine translocase subunit TatC [Chitinophagaceae bacterium]HPG10472.1 twin-arginine translocase subunit TatC [Chitinophagaceae bacterium]